MLPALDRVLAVGEPTTTAIAITRDAVHSMPRGWSSNASTTSTKVVPRGICAAGSSNQRSCVAASCRLAVFMRFQPPARDSLGAASLLSTAGKA